MYQTSHMEVLVVQFYSWYNLVLSFALYSLKVLFKKKGNAKLYNVLIIGKIESYLHSLLVRKKDV